MDRDNRRFRAGSGCYQCGICGKMTRDTGHGEASVEACRTCYEASGIENEHQDGYHRPENDGPREDCPLCQKAREAV